MSSDKLTNKQIRAIVLNILVMVFSAVGGYLCYKALSFAAFKELKCLAALLAFVSSLAYVSILASVKIPKKMPFGVLILRYIAVVTLAFNLVVSLVFAVFSGVSFVSDGGLWINILAAAVSTVSFVLYEGNRKLNKRKNNRYPLIAVVLWLVLAFVLKSLPESFAALPWFAGLGICSLALDWFMAKWILYFNQRLS